jgi:elongator complex protein 3
MMPGMPGSNPQKDIEAFRRIFTDPAFKPDMIKIYPCLAINGTKTYQWYRQGTYTPYTTEQAAEVIAEIKKSIPQWIRVMRVQRDIPAQLILAGVKKSNFVSCAAETRRARPTLSVYSLQRSRPPYAG